MCTLMHKYALTCCWVSRDIKTVHRFDPVLSVAAAGTNHMFCFRLTKLKLWTDYGDQTLQKDETVCFKNIINRICVCVCLNSFVRTIISF